MREQDHDAAPSVIGADWVARQHGEEPETVYLPSARLLEGDTEVTMQLVQRQDGTTVLPAFTTLDALVGSLGGSQPWVAMPQDRVAEVQQQSGADEIVWDVEIRGVDQ